MSKEGQADISATSEWYNNVLSTGKRHVNTSLDFPVSASSPDVGTTCSNYQ